MGTEDKDNKEMEVGTIKGMTTTIDMKRTKL